MKKWLIIGVITILLAGSGLFLWQRMNKMGQGGPETAKVSGNADGMKKPMSENIEDEDRGIRIEKPKDGEMASGGKDQEPGKRPQQVVVPPKKPQVTPAPYYIRVSRSENVMMVYGRDEEGKYGRLLKTFVASTGKNDASPIGVYTVDKRYQWRWAEMFGGAQAQYVTRITGPYLMHSVPYYTRNQDALKWEEFNKLGQQASMGCVRLQLADAKWIYENVTTGTQVEIYHGALPEGVVKPVAPKIEAEDVRRGWDPTNPLAENPWRK